MHKDHPDSEDLKQASAFVKNALEAVK